MAHLTVLFGRNLWSGEPGAVLRLDEQEFPSLPAVQGGDAEARADEAGFRLSLDSYRDSSSGAFRYPELVGSLASFLHDRAGQGVTTFVAAREGALASIFLASREPHFALECLRAADAWLREPTKSDLVARITTLNDHRDDTCLGPSTLSIVDAARRRGIPTLRLSPVDSLVQLGWGARARRIWAAETDASRAIPNEIAQDKDLTRRLLRAAGIPVPDGASVSSAEEAWSVAERVGIPVVVKPQTGSKGRGVSIELTTKATVALGYEVAAKFGQGVVVERYVRGVHHRVLVIGERMIAASRASEEVVFGDGVSSVRELVRQANEDPKRMHGHASILTKLELDPIALELLERRGMTPESVPAVGEKVFIHLNGDLTTDVTDSVHPEVARVCVEAARAIGLQITGVDLLIEDISQPIEAQGGVVVELNARPGLLMHLDPVEGTPRDVGEPILETLFNEKEDGRIPTVLASGGSDRRVQVRVLASILPSFFPALGAATHRGAIALDRIVSRSPSDVATGVERLVMNKRVELLLAERSPEGLVEAGLFLDKSKVAFLSDVQFDSDVHRRAAELILVGASHLVLPATGAALGSSKAQRSIFGAANHERLHGHAANGGRVAYVEDGVLVLREGRSVHRVTPVSAARELGPLDAFCGPLLVAWALGVTPTRLMECLGHPEFRPPSLFA